jgi:hypothetical protein
LPSLQKKLLRQAFPTNGFNIRLIGDEHSEVRRDELQLLERADVGLFNSPQIDPIEHDMASATYKPEVWTNMDYVVRATIRMHLSESVYYTVQACAIVKELWKTLSDTYEKKVAATKIYLIRRLYNLRMKEFDSITAHLNDYEGIISQLLAQGMTINDELKALLLMSNPPPSWETFLTTVCNASATAVKYSETTRSICRKRLGGKHSFKLRQTKPTPYRVRVIDSNIVEGVSRAGRTQRGTEASPGDQ